MERNKWFARSQQKSLLLAAASGSTLGPRSGPDREREKKTRNDRGGGALHQANWRASTNVQAARGGRQTASLAEEESHLMVEKKEGSKSAGSCR